MMIRRLLTSFYAIALAGATIIMLADRLNDPALIGVLTGCAIILLVSALAGSLPRFFSPLSVLGVLISWNVWFLASCVTLVSCALADQTCPLWAGNPPPAYALLHVLGGIIAGFAAIWPTRNRDRESADSTSGSRSAAPERRAPSF